MSKAKALQPKFNVGDTVNYTDRQGRKQSGKVRHIEGKWTAYGSAYLIYTVQHPSYRNGQMHCGEDVTCSMPILSPHTQTRAGLFCYTPLLLVKESDMARYIAVIHGWFVSSNGFNVVELTATEREEAEKEAVFLCHRRAATFDKCAHVVIEIGEAEILKAPRKLTMRERITGRTNP